MEGYSSDGSSSFFTPPMPEENTFLSQISKMNEGSYFQFGIDDLLSWDAYPSTNGWEVAEKHELSNTSGGLTQSQTSSQLQLNQLETSEASYQTKSGGGRFKLTPAQRKENKRQSDSNYRKKLKRTADDQTAENKRLKEENEVLNAENKKLKGLIELLKPHGQLPEEAPQTQDTCIAQSTSKQLDVPSVSVQVSTLETNDLQNLNQKIPINAVATNDVYVTENQKNSPTGTCCDNSTVKVLMEKMDEDNESNLCYSDFRDLDGERKKIGKYNFPLSLHPVVERIITSYGDVSATSKMNQIVVETTYVLFCASIKEMDDLQLEQVTEYRILKWRDTIKDALRINFKVDFAMDHLKKIARAYIGLLERQKLENVAIRISKLEADLNAGKDEHARICEQSKVYMDAANVFNDKPVSAVIFSSMNLGNLQQLVKEERSIVKLGCNLSFDVQSKQNVPIGIISITMWNDFICLKCSFSIRTVPKYNHFFSSFDPSGDCLFAIQLPVMFQTPFLWPLSSVADYMHCQPNILQSNYHQFVLKKVFSSYSFRCSLSLLPVRALQTSMNAGETLMFCNNCWSKDGIKSIQKQNLSEDHQVYGCYSSQEYSNDVDHKEEQRRKKIGLANKGRVPWNKGRKHSAETCIRIKQRTIEALNNPKVRKKMSEHPHTHSEESKARIGSSVRRVWGKRLKWKRLGERFFLSWMKSIAEAARKGGSDQVELEWDSYDKIKQEISLEQLQWAAEKARGKEMAKVRAATAKEEKIARIAQKRKEQQEREKARELKRKMQEKSKKDGKIRRKKSINSQVSIQGDTAHIPALEKLNIELIKKEKMQSEVSLAEQIKAAKSRRAEPISI
ncbi:hypothetical protein REPUB_Repub11eG0045200 [Reevesia pubescens]